MKEYQYSYYKRCTDHEDKQRLKRRQAILETIAGTIFIGAVIVGVGVLYHVILMAIGG